MKNKKVDIAKETRGRSREAIGQVPRTRKIQDKRRKAMEKAFSKANMFLWS